MKAFIAPRYGSPDVLRLIEAEEPVPKESQVLIRVHAVAVNPLDWHKLSGMLPVRVGGIGFFRPKNKIFGADIAGIVEEVGSSVNRFSPGDKVFGYNSYGGFADFICVPEDQLALIPEGVSMEEAAAIPVPGFTALQGLEKFGRIATGQQVLINGASGGVGHLAVQIAKNYNTEVTAVCSTRNLDFVKELGADYVIDYTKEDFIQLSKTYDLVYDAVGNKSASQLQKVLKPNGIASVAGFTRIRTLIGIGIRSTKLPENGPVKPGKKISMVDIDINHQEMELLGNMLADGRLKVHIQEVFPFEGIPEALYRVGSRRIRGKVVVKLT